MTPSVAENPSATPPALALGAPELLRLVVGASDAFAGVYPAAMAEGRKARTLRDLELHFTTAQEVVTGATGRQLAARQRRTALLLGLVMLLVGLPVGGALGWWAASRQSFELPRAEWRIDGVRAGAVVVRQAGRQFPFHVGDVMPNGERLVAVDERMQTVTTESGVFKLQPTAAPRTRTN